MNTKTEDYYTEGPMGNMGNFDNWFRLTQNLDTWRVDNGDADIQTVDGYFIPQSSLTAAIRALHASKEVL